MLGLWLSFTSSTVTTYLTLPTWLWIVMLISILVTLFLNLLTKLLKLKRKRMETAAAQQQLVTVTVPATDPADPGVLKVNGILEVKVVKAGGAGEGALKKI
ncbi:hypothetical protein TSUD_283040 [Trifolium subterraneum]|uniref:Uncharacterized protein n=1 Tax=Trifolium subterraneum TaxID=3900 RepID=A0A2Z6PEJ7_TRISU|nr:hypothetical protein TSUD_283040 [Trifolium subterraneum]